MKFATGFILMMFSIDGMQQAPNWLSWQSVISLLMFITGGILIKRFSQEP